MTVQFPRTPALLLVGALSLTAVLAGCERPAAVRADAGPAARGETDYAAAPSSEPVPRAENADGRRFADRAEAPAPLLDGRPLWTSSRRGSAEENARRAFRWYGFLFARVAVGFSESVSSRPIAARPKKPGFKLWLWKKMVYVIIHYGPLVRERLSLRRKSLPPSTTALFADVLNAKLDTVSDSTLWPDSTATMAQETDDLEGFFRTVLESKWAAVTESDSLAGRVRACVPPAPQK